MDAQLLAEAFPDLGNAEELDAMLKKLDGLPKIDLYKKKVICLPSGYGSKPNRGHILVESISPENVVEGPIAALELDAESCDALLKSLHIMRNMFKSLEQHQAEKAA